MDDSSPSSAGRKLSSAGICVGAAAKETREVDGGFDELLLVCAAGIMRSASSTIKWVCEAREAAGEMPKMGTVT